MVNKSLMTSERVIDPNPKFFPDWADLQWSNFITLFTTRQNDLDFGKALLNTFIIIAFDIIAIPLSASMAAYAFAKLEWKGKNAIFASMMLTITLPGIVTQIPLYVIYSKIGWLNTLLPFTIPNLFGGGAMEMEKGALQDNFYLQLLRNIRRLKLTDYVAYQKKNVTIDITGDVVSPLWEYVDAQYQDFEGDAMRFT